MNAPSAIDALRGWISTGALLGLLTLAARLWISNRKLRLEENQDDREGWRELIEGLRAEVIGLRTENVELRKEIRDLHGIIDGLRRENQAAQISGQRMVRRALEALPQGLGDTE